MPDKDFEQQVRKGLQDWEMAPSAAIRQAVLDKVRERRRRRLVLWAPLALLLLGLCIWGGWYLQRPAAVRVAAVVNAPSPSSSASSAATQAAPAMVTAPAASVYAAATSRTVPPTLVSTPPLVSSIHSADSFAQAIPINSNTSIEQTVTVNLPGNSWINAVTAQKLIPSAPVWRAENPTRAITKQESPWSFHFYAGAGASGQGGLFQFHTPERSVIPSNGLAGASPGGNVPSRDTLVPEKTGPGLELGLGATLRVSKRFQVGAGLAYDRLETKLSGLWQSLQSPNPGFYGTGGAALAQAGTLPNLNNARQVSYINVFQRLRVPLGLTWRMAPASRWNPALVMGASPAYLFRGSALMYQTDGFGYEKNPALYRHWSVDGEVGVTVDVARFKGFVLQVGPVLTYDLFTIQRDAPVADHLNYAGLRIGVVIPAGHKNIQP